MNSRFLYVLFFLSVFLQACVSMAQIPNAPLIERNGNTYYKHIVQKGETAYGISKMYKVDLNRVFAENPGSESGLKVGQELWIPAGNNKTDKGKSKLITHTVQRGETLYAISRKYDVSVEDIVKANPEVEGGLKAGAVLKITSTKADSETEQIVEENELEENPKVPVNHTEKKELDRQWVYESLPTMEQCMDSSTTKLNYVISVLIPFGSGSADELKQSRIAYQFYNGIKLAMQHYQPIKANIEWQVFNTGIKSNDLASRKIVLNPDFKKSDLIIGPLYTSEMQPILQFAKENKVPMISPFSRGEDVLIDNPYVFKASPGEQAYTEGVAQYLNRKYKNGKVILLHTGDKRDSTFYQNLRTILVQQYRFDSISVNKNLVYLPKGSSVAQHLKKDAPNICVYPVKKEIDMNSFMSQMNKIGKENDFSVLGDELWFSFKNFDIEHLNNCKIAVPVLYRTFSWDSTYHSFITNFRTEFKAEPEFYAYRGYELACLSIDMLEKYGNWMAPCAIYDKNSYLITPFQWKKYPGGGFENQALGIMVMEDYKIRYEASYLPEKKE